MLTAECVIDLFEHCPVHHVGHYDDVPLLVTTSDWF